MHNKYSTEEQKQIEKATSYLTENINKSGRNPKPVILHSTRVAMFLYNMNYDLYIIISAFLHDLIEDTDITKEDIENEFGKQVADIVEVMSVNYKFQDFEERYKEHFERIKAFGKDAVIIKCSDLIDNSAYYESADETLKAKVIQKHKDFIPIAQEIIPNTKLLDLLEQSIDV